MRAFRFSVVSGGMLALLGAVVLFGWLLHEPSLVRLIAGAEAMSTASAIGWLCAGPALVAVAATLRVRGRDGAASISGMTTTLLCAAPIVLGLAALGEWVGFFSLGLAPDPVATAAWLDDAYPYAGRMRPLSSVGFISLGAGLLLLSRRHSSCWAERLALLLSLMVLGVGLLGIVGFFTVLSSLSVVPVVTTGIGFMAAGIGLFALQFSRFDAQSGAGADHSQRITLMAGAIVVATGALGILGGFGVLYPQLIEELEEDLTFSLQGRSAALEGAIEQAWEESRRFGVQAAHVAALRRVSRSGADRQPRAALERAAAQAPAFGFSATRFLDAAGAEVTRSGEFARSPELAVALRLPATRLLWQEGYLLHTRVELRSDGRLAGYFEAERRLSVDDLHTTEHLGETLDFPVCAPVGAGLDCFPFRSTGGKALRNLPLTFNGRPIPVAYALAGERGIVRTTDYRGVPVIAAYAPVGELGLVADLKINAAEFYAPAASRAWPLLLVLLLLATGSILVLHLQVVPLVGHMRREIEARRKAEAGLQHSEAKLAEITATLGEGVYVLDAGGALTFVNPEAERLLGWGAAELMGKDAHGLFHRRRPDGTLIAEEACPVHQTFKRGETYRSSDEWFERRDGSFVPVSIVSSPIIRDGKVEGSVASFFDITEQKRMAQELSRHRDHLEQLVQERTRELRKLNRELESFSYSVSHDLRAPLRAINGYSAALREDYGQLFPTEAHQYLDRVQAATVRMGELVDGLLNLSQVIRCEPNLDEVDLSALAESIAASLREAEPRRRVVFRIAPDLTTIGDPALLRVLLENLFVNAWKFTAMRPEGRIEFGRETVTEARPFYVRDNGVGFDMQFAHKLFQPFERLHKHGEFAGNGIGLATVRRIVERHHGRVWAVSGLDQGTVIYFELGRRP